MAFSIGKPVMPKEHGLWAWVFLPPTVGAACAGGNFGIFYPLLGVLFFGFMTLTPARIIYKNKRREAATEPTTYFWTVAYSIPTVGFAVYLALTEPQLIPAFAVMAIGFYLGVRASWGGYLRDAKFEFGGLIALSCGSFLGAYAVAGKITLTDVGIWLLTLLFMTERSVESRRVVRLGGFLPMVAKREPAFAGRLRPVFLVNLGMSFLTMLFALTITERFHLNLSVALTFVPGFFLTLAFYLRPPAKLSVLGYAELFLVIFYGAAFISLFRGVS